MITRRKLQITMALMFLFAMLIPATAASAQSVTLGGAAWFTDAPGSAVGASNGLFIDLTGAPSLGAGFRYEGWLVASDGTKISVGTYTGPNLNGTWVSPSNENLASTYVQLLLTKEPVPDPDLATAGATVLSSTITAGILGPLRALLASSSATASSNGVALALHGQATIAAAHAALSQGSTTLVLMQNHAQHVINVIDGLGEPGDSIGILSYAREAKAQATAAKATVPISTVPAEKFLITQADQVIASADRVIDRAGVAKTNAQALINSSTKNAIADVSAVNVKNMSDQMLSSAASLIASSQALSLFVPVDGLVPAPTAPSAGDELVPMMALLALVAGVVFASGGFAMLRRRGSAA